MENGVANADVSQWTGTYHTAMEGSLRVPFMMRWPGKVPAGVISNEIVHCVDIYTTLALVGGATMVGISSRTS